MQSIADGNLQCRDMPELIFDKAVASSVAHIFDSSGERTVIKVNYVPDLEEMSYVDE